MPRPLVAAGVTALALVVVLVVALLQSDPRVAGTNSVRARGEVLRLGPERACQRGEIVPRGTAAVEVLVHVRGAGGPPVELEVRDSRGRGVARGRVAGGYASGPLKVPVAERRETLGGAQVCLTAAGRGGRVDVLGQANATGHVVVAGEERPGVMRVGYLRPGSESWLALAPTIAHRFAQAKTRVAGAWLFWVVLALIAAGVAIGVWAALTAERARRVAIACAVVAVLNGVAWSLLLPPLQSHDETVHVYYAQRLAETGTPPRPIPGTVLTDEENAVIYGVRLFDVVGNPEGRPPWTELEDRALDRTLASGPSRLSDGADGGVGVYPPLYYRAGAAAYELAGGSLLDRMAAMRLVSALLAGVAAFFVCLFARELLPGRPWAWGAAGVVAAFQPVFAYMSGAFNPDIAVAAAGAVLFWAIARAFRRGAGSATAEARGARAAGAATAEAPGARAAGSATAEAAGARAVGLNPWLGLVIGLALAAGFLSKLAFAGLVPGAVLAVLIAMWRQRAWVGGAVAAAAAAIPVAIYAVVNVTVWDRPALVGGSAPGGGVTGAVGGGGVAVPGFNLREALVYVWQVHFPRLPFMNDVATDYPLWDRYFTGWVGRFGWGDYAFPGWVPAVALAVGLVLLAAGVALAFRHRTAFAARWPEWLSYAALAAGLLFLLAYTGYDYAKKTGARFEQGRYLLPLHALYAGIVAAGLRGLGARIGPIVAAVLVVLAAGMSVWAELLTVARFYG